MTPAARGGRFAAWRFEISFNAQVLGQARVVLVVALERDEQRVAEPRSEDGRHDEGGDTGAEHTESTGGGRRTGHSCFCDIPPTVRFH